MSVHQNNGHCEGCQGIFNKYPGFYEPLKEWFMGLQVIHPKVHISCAGRGGIEQAKFKLIGLSRAEYGESAHNWNAAIDIFLNQKNIYDNNWFYAHIPPSLPPEFNWYGSKDSKFYELPHIEVRDWKELAKIGELKLIGNYI